MRGHRRRRDRRAAIDHPERSDHAGQRSARHLRRRRHDLHEPSMAGADARNIRSRARERPGVASTEDIETSTMVRPERADRASARMVELKGVDAGFPFYGAIELESRRPYSHAL